MSVLNVLTYIVTGITAHSISLAVILEINVCLVLNNCCYSIYWTSSE